MLVYPKDMHRNVDRKWSARTARANPRPLSNAHKSRGHCPAARPTPPLQPINPEFAGRSAGAEMDQVGAQALATTHSVERRGARWRERNQGGQ
jgi:hypothetical protein